MVPFETIKITPEMLNLIAEIHEFKGAWHQGIKVMPERLAILKHVATVESIGSSTRIEGAKLSDSEIDKLLLQSKNNNFKNRDEQEVAGYAFACEQICENFLSIPLTESAIKQLHMWLLQYAKKDERHRGVYKILPIRIEAFDAYGQSVGVIFETTSPMATPIQMQELIQWTNEAFEKRELHPIIIIGIFVVLFLAIHPFQDGNGRLSRLLTTLLLLKQGYSYVPYASLESIIETNKEAYYLALQRTQKAWQSKQYDWDEWLMFFCHCLQRQKRHLEIKLEKEKVILKVLSPLSMQILELISAHGRLTISEIAALTLAKRNTLKKALETLVREHYIVRNGIGKGSWYAPN